VNPFSISGVRGMRSCHSISPTLFFTFTAGTSALGTGAAVLRGTTQNKAPAKQAKDIPAVFSLKQIVDILVSLNEIFAAVHRHSLS
jgi:hypothetical protein